MQCRFGIVLNGKKSPIIAITLAIVSDGSLHYRHASIIEDGLVFNIFRFTFDSLLASLACTNVIHDGDTMLGGYALLLTVIIIILF